MLNVPIDRIVPLTDARDNFSRLVTDIEKQTDGMYVLTKGGKPSIALVNINFLAKLMNGEVPIAPPSHKQTEKNAETKPVQPSQPALEPKKVPSEQTKKDQRINPTWTGSSSPWPLPPKDITIQPKKDVAPILEPTQEPVKPPAPPQPKPAPVPTPLPKPIPPPKPITPAASPKPASAPLSAPTPKPIPPPPPVPTSTPPTIPPPPKNDAKIPFSDPPKTVLEPGEEASLPPMAAPKSSTPQSEKPTSQNTPAAPKPAQPSTPEPQVKDLDI